MQVTLTPKAEQALREEMSRSPGRKPEEIVEEALARITAGLRQEGPAVTPEFHAWLQELRQGAKAVPQLDNQTFARGMIYQDHD